MPTPEEYKVRLDVFEGPLDLLLYLIKKDEVDIYNIPIERIAVQYMDYLNLMRMLDLNIAGEFLVMAATLMMIKSRMLLPADERPEMEAEEDDPRWDLVRQLVEYKKFKDAANRLQEKEYLQEHIFPLSGEGVLLEPEDPGLSLQDVSLFDLISAFNQVLARAPEEQLGQIYGEQFTVADKIDVILNLVRTRRGVAFGELFTPAAHRHEIICTFLALLELIRLRQIGVTQREHFGEIVIHAADVQDLIPDGGGEPEPEAAAADDRPAAPEPEAEGEGDHVGS